MSEFHVNGHFTDGEMQALLHAGDYSTKSLEGDKINVNCINTFNMCAT